MFNNFFSNIVPIMTYVEIYGTAGQATDGNMAHVHCCRQQAASPVRYTTSCKHSLVLLRMAKLSPETC